MKKVVVIVGAGASFDVHNRSMPAPDPRLRPPLARDLFDQRFWRERAQYPGAVVLGSTLGELAQSATTFDLEEHLTTYANNEDERTRRHFKDIPPYLRDVLTRVSREYSPVPSNYVDLVRKLLEGRAHEIVFVVLNYDTLLEKAIALYDESLKIEELSDYVGDHRQARVVKIHGSINWAVPIPGSSSMNWAQAMDGFNPASAPDDQILVNHSREETNQWRARGPDWTWLYPRLTAPLRGKTFTCPQSHTKWLSEFMGDCSKYLVIGTSGLDDDLLEFLQENSPSGGNLVHYVSADPEATADCRGRFEATVRNFRVVGPASRKPRMSESGFGAFLQTDDLDRFLDAG